MFRNYLLIAWRNLKKNQVFAAINIAGLALGVFVCLTIFLYIRRELSYDRFHAHGQHVYRVNMDVKWGEKQENRATTPPPAAEVLARDIPEVAAATRIYPVPGAVVFNQGKVFRDDKILATDPAFFEVFSFRLQQGNPKTALAQPNSVLLTPRVARNYFGTTGGAVGKTLLIGRDRTPFRVTGIIQEAPVNSHIRYDLLTSINSYETVRFFHWSWIWTQLTTYVRLQPGASPEKLTPALERVVDTYAPAAFERLGFPYRQFKSNHNYWRLYLQPLHRIWLHSPDLGNILGSVGDILFVRAFAFIGVLILLLACINFINLSTAGAMNRAREVGVRKAIGTSRLQLIHQFLTESYLLALLAVGVGLTLTQAFANLAPALGVQNFTPAPPDTPLILGAVVVFPVLLSLLAGLYPALYLSRARVVQALKGGQPFGRSGAGFRNILVVFQFCMAVGMILVTMVAMKQVRFMREGDMGFAHERLVVVGDAAQLGQNAEYFGAQLQGLPGVVSASYSTSTFPNYQFFEDTYQPRQSPVKEAVLTSFVADAAFVATLGLQLKAGRGFRKNDAADRYGVILSELAAQKLGWSDPVGKELHYPGFPARNGQTFRVIGVVNNFHSLPLQSALQPFAIFLPESGHPHEVDSYWLVRVQGDVPRALAAVKGVWDKTAGGWPFGYTFVDEAFGASYRSYEAMQAFFVLFTVLAIAISCMGLLGLAVFATHKRTKEIGIRKVMGAPVLHIVLLLNGQFLLLLAVAFGIGAPLGCLLIGKWLQNFTYRTSVGVLDVSLAALIALLTALATVSYISLKAARMNPVNSLRSE
jgi:putative ABC transport system permease protein